MKVFVNMFCKSRVLYTLAFYLLGLTIVSAQSDDLGQSAISKLTWDQIETSPTAGTFSIGLTKDNKMYVWGDNSYFLIHTRAVLSGSAGTPGQPLVQSTPYYLPSPAGEKVIKVATTVSNIGVFSSTGANIWSSFFGCLTESGKLYGWGLNTGMFSVGVAGWPILTTSPSPTDSTVAKRTPQQLTILGESTFVDFAFPSFSNYWIAIGASGKAYHIGNIGNGTYSASFAAIPNPAGVDPATFKYVRVWGTTTLEDNQVISTYLKGNDGKIYYTGTVGSGLVMGVPAYYSNFNTNTYPDAGGSPPSGVRNLRTDIPQLVPFPAGEDIVQMEFGGFNSEAQTFYAISASGKAFAAGFWGLSSPNVIGSGNNKRYFAYPLANAPVLGTELAVLYLPSTTDTLYTLKRFCEIALPPGTSKIVDIEDFGKKNRNMQSCLVIGDNNKAYWAGRHNIDAYLFPNYLEYSDPAVPATYRCSKAAGTATPSQTQWVVEAINYRGIAKMFNKPKGNSNNSDKRFIISKSGRGYFEGAIDLSSGLGKPNVSSGTQYALQPMPIANEQLDLCNPNPGEAVAGTAEPTPGVGAIDCSKTKLSPAPVAGVPSQLNLQVTINVTTAGSFSLLSVSGSGMSLGNGITSVTTTTPGVQTFTIPINYSGEALTNAFQFTIGQAGGCTADLTTKPNNEITKVWSLTNCSAITPGVLTK